MKEAPKPYKIPVITDSDGHVVFMADQDGDDVIINVIHTYPAEQISFRLNISQIALFTSFISGICIEAGKKIASDKELAKFYEDNPNHPDNPLRVI